MNTTTTDAALAPVSRPERVDLLDVLRGFALLGILLMNIEAFVGPLASAVTGLDPQLTGLDRWADAAIYVIVQGKFYPLFALLFGAGFAMILLRSRARGAGGGWLYLRRTLVLLAIGLLHYLYVWSGDILTNYALTALVMLALFRRTPTARLRTWGLALFSVPIVLMLLFGSFGELARQDPASAAQFQLQLDEQAREMAAIEAAQRAAYGPDGSFAEANRQRRADFGWMMGYVPIMFMPLVLGLFLLGAWLLRSGIWLQPDQHIDWFRRWRRLGFAIGLPLALWSFWRVPTADFARMDIEAATAAAAMQAAGLLLCLAYASSIALGLHNPRWQRRLLWLAPAGRMALSNYLLQSIVCVGLFYGYGLGYFERLPRAWQVPFVLALYVAQVAFSHWWLARYRFGPVEWLWRSLTYLSPQPMRRPA